MCAHCPPCTICGSHEDPGGFDAFGDGTEWLPVCGGCFQNEALMDEFWGGEMDSVAELEFVRCASGARTLYGVPTAFYLRGH